MSYIAENIEVVDNTVKFNVSVETQAAGAAQQAAQKAKESADRAADIAKRYNFITPNMFAGQGMTDHQKVQEALLWAIQKKKSLYIPWNEERDSDTWLLDEAVLLPSNSIIYIDNARLKLSDIARDNIFRSANCGIGIQNPHENPLHNISIIGVGEARLEGADNPRSTGDGGKTLSIDSTVSGSYGTDALNPDEKQTGDWRNIGLILAYTTGFEIKGINFNKMHAYGSSFERCASGSIGNIKFDNPQRRVYNGIEQLVRNCDGINLRWGGHDINIFNISGHTDDDVVALTEFGTYISEAGDLVSMNATQAFYNPEIDGIHNVSIDNIKAWSYNNIVRVLNTYGTKIWNINISNITDTSTASKLDSEIRGGAISFGSNNPSYGGATPLGSCYNISVDNVKCVNTKYGVNIQGSLSESRITNLSKLNNTGFDPIYVHPNADGTRNIYTENITEKNIKKEIFNVMDGPSGGKTGISHTDKGLIISDSGLKGISVDRDYSPNFTNFSLVHKGFVLSYMNSILKAPPILDDINARADLEGFAKPSLSTQTYISELIGELYTYGVWDKLDLFLNFAYNDPSLSNYGRINWKDPEGSLSSIVEGVASEQYGLLGDGVNGHINTHFNPRNGSRYYLQNNASRGGVVYHQENNIFDGIPNGVHNSLLLNDTLFNQLINTFSGNIDSPVPLSGTGFKSINRDSETSVRIFNKNQEYQRTSAVLAIANGEQVILRRQNSYSLNGVSMYFMGGALTKEETLGLQSAFNNYLIKVGLNPIA